MWLLAMAAEEGGHAAFHRLGIVTLRQLLPACATDDRHHECRGYHHATP